MIYDCDMLTGDCTCSAKPYIYIIYIMYIMYIG
jgi:hypothetical protein